jgi:hypothetical protein
MGKACSTKGGDEECIYNISGVGELTKKGHGSQGLYTHRRSLIWRIVKKNEILMINTSVINTAGEALFHKLKEV